MSHSIPDYHSPNQRLLGHGAALLFATLIAGSFSLGGMAAPHIDAAALNAIRYILGGIFLGTLAFSLHGKASFAPKASWRYLILGALMSAYFITMFTALSMTNVVSIGAVFALVPLMSVGFTFLFLRRLPSPIVWLSLILGALGAIWVIFRGDVAALKSFSVGKGEIIFFGGCIAHAIYAPLYKKFNRDEPVLLSTLWTILAVALCSTIYGIIGISQTDWLHLPGIVWIALAYLSTVTTAGTFFLVQFATLRLPPAKVLAYGYLIPTIIIFYEGLLGHGWVSLPVLAGAALTVTGLLVMFFNKDI